ncbi:hypothetical protein [Phaeobacter inhibens]|uniref:hypothetical protein n=1 Tax=Phaeobacter inhibens TaxID=221822 RepID=UPI0021A534B1|nr:hypothetical protein [Phaeobacter inhibens]UWR41522.1 hypothetical protein K4F85_01040 [Phaeobacter inhibens]UWR74060.1 hypothetical protein K4L00_08140 [Phaeobacter inhibens]
MKWPQFLRGVDAAAKKAALARAELRTDKLREKMAQRRHDLLRKTIEQSKRAKQADG